MILNNIDNLIQEMTVHDAYDHLKHVGSEIGQKISDKYHSIKTALDNPDITGITHSQNQKYTNDLMKEFPGSKLRGYNTLEDTSDGRSMQVVNNVETKIHDRNGDLHSKFSSAHRHTGFNTLETFNRNGKELDFHVGIGSKHPSLVTKYSPGSR